ncbi:MAG TPA: FtsX-like permease family protein [Ktedonobacteraceae bacterium]|nr:FtsX-like permease family protein [Ktedonobacteraceae bacterium]
MTTLFGLPVSTLTTVLLSITLAILGFVALLALTNLIFFKIGARNIPRRRAQMVLITFALMLSTTLLTSVLATGDVINEAVQSVAVYNLGAVDETISGGHGDLGFFPDGTYYRLMNITKSHLDIAAIGAAMVEPNLLIADVTSRQVRSKVTGLGVINGSEQGFGGMQDVTNSRHHLSTAKLGLNQVYLNQTLAQLLNARAGDTLYMYSPRWPGRRYSLHVVAVVTNGGLVGEGPTILSNIATFRAIEGPAFGDYITQIYVANSGGTNGVNLSNQVAQTLQTRIPSDVRVNEVKQQGVQNSQKAQDIFSRIYALFSLFALAIGLLLIFLIFVLLAAERRKEMGMARAIGVQRRHLVLMFLFEGTIYDVIASLIGIASGVGLGALLVLYLGPILARFNFPLKLTLSPSSLIIACCLGVIFTFFSVALASWLVSRMTVVEAMRDLPEQGQYALSLGEVCVRLLVLLRNAVLQFGRGKQARIRRLRRIVFEQLPDIFVGLVRSLSLLGFLPLLIGLWVLQVGLERVQVVYFSLGISLIVFGGALLVRAFLGLIAAVGQFMRGGKPDSDTGMKRIGNQLFALVVGGLLVAYWALPFDALARLGLPRFQGGIEVFFVAGLMMVLGMVWVVVANAQVIVQPILTLCSRLPGVFVLTRLASAYPLHNRFRTGLNLVMFSLVVFAMTVMAVITTATENTYASIDSQTGGYDIQAVAYFKDIPNIQSELASHGINPGAFSSIGEETTTAVGVIQLSASNPAWRAYPAQVVSGGFLHGYGLHLTARALGFNSDSAVWQALQTHANYALIDSSALPYRPDTLINGPVYDPNAPLPADAGQVVNPPGIPQGYAFSISGVYQGDTSFAAAPVWVTDIRGAPAMKLTIIGVVDNSDQSHFGIYIPLAAYNKIGYNPINTQITPFTDQNTNYFQTTYYFKVAPGQDKRALALQLGSVFLNNGLETTVLEDAIWQIRGPRIFLSNVLLGVVGLTLLLGITALAITGTRAVIERRQQIGMLRALGCHRRLIQGAFLCESFLVGALGSLLGVVLGLILSRNIFAANFFEQFQTGLVFSIPWQELAIIVGIALLASFVGALLPAWQAGRVSPAEALRYQ